MRRTLDPSLEPQGLACEDPHQDDDVFHPGVDSNQSRRHIEVVPSSLSLSLSASLLTGCLTERKGAPATEGGSDVTRDSWPLAQWDDKLCCGVHVQMFSGKLLLPDDVQHLTF